MKKYILILTILVLPIFNSCTDNFDPKLYGSLSSTTFPSSASEYELYMLELYKPFQSKWGYSSLNWENNFYSPEYGHIVQNDLASDLMPVFTNWGGFWEGFSRGDFSFLKNQNRSSHFEKVRFITRATKIIFDIENANIDVATKTQLIAEAKMARGGMMYYLLWMYGPVPVILDANLIGTEAEANVKRPSRLEYVSAIENDLRFASDNLPKTAKDYGRFNKGCALTFLTRLYLNEKNFIKAENTAREILPLGYDLVQDYSSLFREATEKNIENIWTIPCNNPSGAGGFNAWAFYCYPTDYPGIKIKGGWGGDTGGVLSANWSFYDSFESGDKRKNLIIGEYISKSGQIKNRSNLRGAVIAKYPDEGGLDNSTQGNDIVVCRYADVLLMLAEAINENSGPTVESINLVNKIRFRANLDDLPSSSTISKDAFRDAIYIERGHELYFEGLRRIDMIRMGKWTSEMTAAGKFVGPALFPVPTYAINNSNGMLEQTDGYSQ